MLSLKSGKKTPDPEDTFARQAHLLDSSADSLSALRVRAVGMQPITA